MIWCTHMKTTIEITAPLLEQARSAAARERTTVRALVEEGLRRVLAERARRRPVRRRDGSVGGKGVRPELAEAPWAEVRDEIDRGRGA